MLGRFCYSARSTFYALSYFFVAVHFVFLFIHHIWLESYSFGGTQAFTDFQRHAGDVKCPYVLRVLFRGGLSSRRLLVQTTVMGSRRSFPPSSVSPLFCPAESSLLSCLDNLF